MIVGLWWLIEATGRLRTYRNAGVDRCDGAGAGSPPSSGTTKIAKEQRAVRFESRRHRDRVAGAGTPCSTAPPPRASLSAVVAGAPRRCSGLIVLAGGDAGRRWRRGRCSSWSPPIPWYRSARLDGVLSAFGGYFCSGHRLTFVVAMFSAAAAGVAWGSWCCGQSSGGDIENRCGCGRFGGIRAGGRGDRGVAVGSYHDNSFRRTPAPNASVPTTSPPTTGSPSSSARGSLILNNLDQGTGWIYPVTRLTLLFRSTAPTSGPRASVRVYWAPRTSAATRTSTSWSATCTSASSSTARRATGSSERRPRTRPPAQGDPVPCVAAPTPPGLTRCSGRATPPSTSRCRRRRIWGCGTAHRRVLHGRGGQASGVAVGIGRLPAPGVGAHIVDGFGCGPTNSVIGAGSVGV